MSRSPAPSNFPPPASTEPATRWLLIGGDDRTLDALRQAAGLRPVHRLDNFLQALGDIGVHGQPQLVFAQAAILRHPWPATLNALRRLAPQARLILLDWNHATQDHHDIPLGVHAVLNQPITPQRIADLLNPNPAPTPPPTPPLDKPLGLLIPNDPTHAGSSRLPSIPDDELGDVDLLDHLTHRRPNFAGLAMRLVRARSGLTDLIFTPAPGSPHFESVGSPDIPSVSVTHQNQTFGSLHSPSASSNLKLLQVWADWLGAWLAMAQQVNELWTLAYKDDLTGVWNRRYFYHCLGQLLSRAANERFRVTVMVFDIDDFKQFNDRCGHDVGDLVLQETARLMQSVVREHDVVARIGGDEFAVIFWDAQAPRKPNSQHPDDVRAAARRFQQAVAAKRFPKLVAHNLDGLTISGGLAGFPWDGRTPQELVHLADQMALQSKRQGKNDLTFGPGALRSENPQD